MVLTNVYELLLVLIVLCLAYLFLGFRPEADRISAMFRLWYDLLTWG